MGSLFNDIRFLSFIFFIVVCFAFYIIKNKKTNVHTNADHPDTKINIRNQQHVSEIHGALSILRFLHSKDEKTIELLDRIASKADEIIKCDTKEEYGNAKQ